MSDLPFDTASRDPIPLLPASTADPAGQLPRPLTSFIGRDREIEAVSTLLQRPNVRLVTLTGPGGVGKTRLALRAGAAWESHADVAWFVPLAAIRDPATVPVTIAQSLGLSLGDAQTAGEALIAFLGDRRGLLILDNFEQILGAAPFVATLLARCAELVILATSRSPLRVSGEHVYAIPPLVLAVNRDTPDIGYLVDVESVRLFVERAQASSAAFSLTSANAADVIDVCRRLDGLPLAIELAAARVAVLPLPLMLDRLDRRLAVLTGGSRDAPDRQRTMRDTIAWSYELLDTPEQAVFRRLGVFVDGFTLEAAESVMAAGRAGDVMESVISLAASHLVLVVADEPRFMMLETIREFALECLTEAGEEGAIRRGHAVYFTSLAENAIPFYDGPQANNYRIKIERELENCRAALGWSVAGGDRELAIRLSGALYRVWWNLHDLNGQGWQEYIDEGRRWLERALEMRDGLPLAILVEAIMGAATYALLAGDLDRAQAWGEELLRQAEREGHPYGQFNAYQILGRIAMERPDLPSARNWYDQALACTPIIRDPDNHAAIALMHLGFVAERAGYLERAETRFRDAVAHSRLSGNAFILHEALVSMGRVGLDRGNLAEAMKVLHECYQWSREEPSRYVTSDALIAMSLVALGVRDQEQSVRLLAAATTSHKLVMGELECTVAMGRIRDVTPKPVFNTAWEHGERMSWTEIDADVASLLGHVLDHAAPAAAVSGDRRLTPREREVLRLVAEGKSNRAIGDSLSISERTVENHVQHILARLNLESRTAAATWAVRHGLV